MSDSFPLYGYYKLAERFNFASLKEFEKFLLISKLNTFSGKTINSRYVVNLNESEFTKMVEENLTWDFHFYGKYYTVTPKGGLVKGCKWERVYTNLLEILKMEPEVGSFLRRLLSLYVSGDYDYQNGPTTNEIGVSISDPALTLLSYYHICYPLEIWKGGRRYTQFTQFILSMEVVPVVEKVVQESHSLTGVRNMVYPNQKWKVLKDVQSDLHPTRILRPVEFELLLEGSRVEENKIRLIVALITGMRYAELRKFQDHPEWYDEESNFIEIPEETKAGRKHPRRYIRLPNIAREVIPRFFELKLKYPTEQGWIENLKRWMVNAGLDPAYVGTKTTRKTWESWLILTYPHRIMEIVMSQGHTVETSLNHYFNIPFTPKDRQEMKKWVDGW